MKSNLSFHVGIIAICISLLQTGQPQRADGQQTNGETESGTIMTLVVSAGDIDRQAAPVRIELKNSKLEPGNYYLESERPWDNAQATVSPGKEKGTLFLDFVIRDLSAGKTITYEMSKLVDLIFFHQWEIEKGKTADLKFHGQPVLRYMFEPLDNSSSEDRGRTYKVYHHVYSPDGNTLLTKGPGGLYPHHRGIFFGFNKISYGDKQADTWHCNNGESQINVADDDNSLPHAYPHFFAGTAMAENRNLIQWNGRDGKMFAMEQRTLRTWHIDQVNVIDFESVLSATIDEPIQLKGDPQHAGVQFRASQHVPETTKSKTFYIRPDGIGKPGQFRNWPANKQHRNLPWNAMCFEVDGKTYTCCYFDHPDNPKPSRYSERDYGRFGSYFEFELTRENPLKVKYRFLIREGVMSVEDIDRLHKDFVNPVTATITAR